MTSMVRISALFRILLFGLTGSCWIFSISIYGQNKVKQGSPVPDRFCIRETEMKLYRMVNEYRALYNLPAVPLSKSLCYVASIHAKDLMLFHPDQGDCNFHSWSNRGSWTPFCYPKDESKKASVWDKPRELTTYPAKAWEIVYWENTQLIPDSIFSTWRSEPYFNDFLLNTGKWQGQMWNAMGIAIFEHYVCAWFGQVSDPEGLAYVCGSAPVKSPVPETMREPTEQKTQAKDLTKTPDTIPVRKQTVVTDKAENVQPGSGSWYIVVKTNITAQAAEKLAIQLRSKDFPDAKVLDGGGKIRVTAYGPADKPSAAEKLKEVKKLYKDAWLLKE